MHTNILAYWQHLQNLPNEHRGKPSLRVCRSMLEMFELWLAQSPFPDSGSMGHLRDHLSEDEAHIMSSPLQVRRGHAMKKMLEQITGGWGRWNGFFRINSDELIVGTMPPFRSVKANL